MDRGNQPHKGRDQVTSGKGIANLVTLGRRPRIIVVVHIVVVLVAGAPHVKIEIGVLAHAHRQNERRKGRDHTKDGRRYQTAGTKGAAAGSVG